MKSPAYCARVPGRAADDQPPFQSSGRRITNWASWFQPWWVLDGGGVGEVAVDLDAGHPAGVAGAGRVQPRPVGGVGVAGRARAGGGQVVEAGASASAPGTSMRPGGRSGRAASARAVLGPAAMDAAGVTARATISAAVVRDRMRDIVATASARSRWGTDPQFSTGGVCQPAQPIGNTSKGAANRTPSRCPACREKPSRIRGVRSAPSPTLRCRRSARSGRPRLPRRCR